MDILLVPNGAEPRRVIAIEMFEGLLVPVNTDEDFGDCKLSSRIKSFFKDRYSKENLNFLSKLILIYCCFLYYSFVIILWILHQKCDKKGHGKNPLASN